MDSRPLGVFDSGHRRHLPMRVPCIVLFGLFLATAARSQISTNVTPSDSAYDTLERLEGWRCAFPTLRVLRPLTHADLRGATDAGERGQCRLPEWLALERAFLMRPIQGTEVLGGPLLLHEDLTPLPGLDAAVAPLFPLRDGWLTFNGPTIYAGVMLAAGGGREKGFAISVTPAFVAGFDNYRSLMGRLVLQEGYVKAGSGYFEASLGRMAMRFGSAAHGSLILGGAAKPLDALKIALRPHAIGGLEFLGPITLETWLSFNGESSFVDDSRFFATAFAFRPASWFELALMEIYQFGGTGAPSLGLSDYLGFLVYASDDKVSRRQRGLASHLAFWGPSRRFKLYFQTFFDSLGSFSDDMSFLVGGWLPRLGEVDLRVELVRTAPNGYTHPFWRQGFSLKGTPLGHPLGPDAFGLYGDLGLPALGGWKLSLAGILEQRLRTPTATRDTETRVGGGVDLHKRFDFIELTASARFHAVTNAGFVSGQNTPLAGLFGWMRYTLL